MEIKQLPPEIQLTPPWYTLANQIKYTYGCATCVCVGNLIQDGENYKLPINVSDDNVAMALVQILPSIVSYGNINVNIIIYNSTGNIVGVPKNGYSSVKELANVFCSALKCNPYFSGIVIPPVGSGVTSDLYIIIPRMVIQFFNDDISDLCQNYNEVAAKVFASVTKLNYVPGFKVQFSTCDENCALMKTNLYKCPK